MYNAYVWGCGLACSSSMLRAELYREVNSEKVLCVLNTERIYAAVLTEGWFVMSSRPEGHKRCSYNKPHSLLSKTNGVLSH